MVDFMLTALRLKDCMFPEIQRKKLCKMPKMQLLLT